MSKLIGSSFGSKNDYTSMTDLWARAESAANQERKFLNAISFIERQQIPKIIEELQHGYYISEINQFTDNQYFLILEHENTGKVSRYGFSVAMPIEGIPILNVNPENLSKRIQERNEFLLKFFEGISK